MFSSTLFETLPTYLLQKLANFYERVSQQSKLQSTSHRMSVGEHRVYDLVNCGHRKSFAVGARATTIVHNCGYGAGAGKIRMGLAQQGVEMSLNEAKRMHTAYWALFSQVKAFGRWLEAMWENNGGWWLNGIGIPLCLAEDYKRDIVNRHCQGTGHSIFTLFTVVLAQALEEQDIWYAPFIWDIHDCVSFECRDEDREAVQRIVDVDVVQRVNAILGEGYVDAVKLKWDANIVKTWAEDKTEAGSVESWGV